jgi:type I restriction-modification system DNA methylase subunit
MRKNYQSMKTDKQLAADFAKQWKGKGDEKQETQRFWIQLLSEVLGVTDATNRIEFEKRVQLSHTSFIDAYIPETKVLIEQKSTDINLHKQYKQSDGEMLTPYGQAKRYVSEMKASEKPRWIVVCNFQEFLVYDLEKPGEEPEQIFLKRLGDEYYRLQFLVDQKSENIRREEEVSLEAGALVGKLYDALLKEYINPDEDSLRSLNILCVRIVFCLYAEDAELFETRTAFEDYISSFSVENVRDGIIKLFKALDTKKKDRDKYDTKLNPFPYVNGGLFAAENIEIPNFTEEIVDVIVNHCAPFNWSEISPTIFGAVFESTLNPETRRKGGMHYTSIANIHRVINPLFMESLYDEYDEICRITAAKARNKRFLDFQKKLGSLTFLDPACGSGNFLTETYLSLRRLENAVIHSLNRGEKVIGLDNFIHVKISQFFGIEINDFAVTVAKTALWIAESQMMKETEEILGMNIDFLPLTTNAFIVEGNALRMDWATLKNVDETQDSAPMQGLFAGFTAQTDGKAHHYDFIIGNPPFLGYSLQTKEQKADLQFVMPDFGSNIDYVCAWYKKAAELMANNTNTRAALVSTNSITQGEQVAILWKPLFEKYGVQIDFAWRTFRWDSESNQKAHVHCVIVGFSCRDALNASAIEHIASSDARSASLQRRIFNVDGTIVNAQNINGYLLDAPNIFIEKRSKPLCEKPIMIRGSSPIDDGNLLLTIEEKEEYLKQEPQGEKFLRPFMMGKDFIERKPRWCFWLVGANPSELRKCPILMKRIGNVRDFRLKSTKSATKQIADTPTLFGEMRPCESEYIAIPKVSSEQRRYIPIEYLRAEIIAGDKLFQMPNATLYHFGVLTSSVHMAWMRAVCGRLEMRYSYSNTIVYNNFPWPVETFHETSLQTKIEKTAQAILDARALYPDSSLADLYNETLMPPELRRAHRANDEAVMDAYGWVKDLSESEVVARLFQMYESLIGK